MVQKTSDDINPRRYTKWTHEKIQIAENMLDQGSSAADFGNATDVIRRYAELHSHKYLESGNFYISPQTRSPLDNSFLKTEVQRILTEDCTLKLDRILKKLPSHLTVSNPTLSRVIKEIG